jgi:DNA repair exonuclease SbcCD nuclease subunit
LSAHFKFLHAADLHIDSPLRGLSRHEGAPLERLRGATRRALQRLVALAIAEQVQFVVLAGDIYDRDWQDFRTGLFFREQMVALQRHGIAVFVLHGNHDAQGVISRDLPLPDNVRVFSSRTAQSFAVPGLAATLHGRSFPNRAVAEDLVPDYPAPQPGHFNIGVLHTSLSGASGHDSYAPTRLDVLCARGYDYWALGHVHARQVLRDAAPRIVWPGNLQGRHALETGAKGCELVSVVQGAIASAEFVALDEVRWHQLDLNLSGADQTLPAFAELLRQRLRALLDDAPERLHALRLCLSGISALAEEEARTPGRLQAECEAAVQDVAPDSLWIEQVRVQLRSPWDREQLAGAVDARGELVRLVDELGADDAALAAFASDELSTLLASLPLEVRDGLLPGAVPDLTDLADLRSLLQEAEATLLARLGPAVAGVSGGVA